jgi:hypothetical protein
MNIRSMIGKKGWDFSIHDDELGAESPRGDWSFIPMTKTEKEIYKIAFKKGYIAGVDETRKKIKEALGL